MINYYLLTKPGIILGNLITFAAGFLLASKGEPDWLLFLYALLGTILVIASACVFNNCIDRQRDKKMKRTRNRPLVTGTITLQSAVIFGSFLGLAGFSMLASTTNILTLGVAGVGFFVYVVLYSLWKGQTIYGTAIGSIAGATPPLIGYCAVSNQVDAAAIILFAMLIFWQMAHFFSIALLHLKDYAMANIPVLPVKKGTFRTQMHMMIYIAAFTFTSALLTVLNFSNQFFLMTSIALGFIWLLLCLSGFFTGNLRQWSRWMFQYSLILITTICLLLSFQPQL